MAFGCDYPSRAEIKSSLSKIREQPKRRYETTSDLLETLREPRSTDEAARGRSAIADLATIYLHTEDHWILQAFDDKQGESYFTFMLCEFYAAVVENPKVQRRYTAKDRAIKRCDDQTWPHGTISSRLPAD